MAKEFWGKFEAARQTLNSLPGNTVDLAIDQRELAEFPLARNKTIMQLARRTMRPRGVWRLPGLICCLNVCRLGLIPELHR